MGLNINVQKSSALQRSKNDSLYISYHPFKHIVGWISLDFRGPDFVWVTELSEANYVSAPKAWFIPNWTASLKDKKSQPLEEYEPDDHSIIGGALYHCATTAALTLTMN